MLTVFAAVGSFLAGVYLSEKVKAKIAALWAKIKAKAKVGA